MISISDLITIITLCVTVFKIGYIIGRNDIKNK